VPTPFMDNLSLPDLVLAIGGLGTAAFALVDASKLGRHGGVSHSGFSSIESAVRLFLDDARLPGREAIASAGKLRQSVLQVLHANWINGMALGDQKAVAKSLVKLHLRRDNAAHMAEQAGVEAGPLAEVADLMNSGAPLSPVQANALGRFDLAVTAILDAAYQRADQRYRNTCRVWAGVAAMALALLGGLTLDLRSGTVSLGRMAVYLFCGILAVPLAPITKDLASALSAGVKLAQTVRR
jgi:hypothetical protein